MELELIIEALEEALVVAKAKDDWDIRRVLISYNEIKVILDKLNEKEDPIKLEEDLTLDNILELTISTLREEPKTIDRLEHTLKDIFKEITGLELA